jgi:hypothetical protein
MKGHIFYAHMRIQVTALLLLLLAAPSRRDKGD